MIFLAAIPSTAIAFIKVRGKGLCYRLFACALFSLLCACATTDEAIEDASAEATSGADIADVTNDTSKQAATKAMPVASDPAAPKDKRVYRELSSSIRFYDQRFRKTLRESTRSQYAHKALMLWIPAVNGNLYGSVNGEAMVKPRLDEKLHFRINMATLAGNVALGAKPVTADFLTVEPAQTRIARVPAYVLDTYNGEMLGKARWFNPSKRRELLLVYVDRPCSITGTIERDGKRYEHDIRLDRPGLHWLRRSSDSKRRAKIVARTRPGKIALAVAPKPVPPPGPRREPPATKNELDPNGLSKEKDPEQTALDDK